MWDLAWFQLPKLSLGSWVNGLLLLVFQLPKQGLGSWVNGLLFLFRVIAVWLLLLLLLKYISYYGQQCALNQYVWCSINY